MRVLVVGNGFTRHEESRGDFVNVHTADFLVGLANLGHEVAIAQPLVNVVSEAGLNNALLPPERVQVVGLDKRNLLRCFAALRALISADFVYIFFPGSWPRLLGALCRWLGKPYALYVRGEQFAVVGGDAKLLSGALALVTETGLDRRLLHLNNRIIPIAPMIEMNPEDQIRRDFTKCLGRPLRLLFVGRIEAAKGIPELIDAANLLISRGISFELRLVGGGPLLERLSAQMSATSVSLVGVVSDKRTMMAQYEWADVLVLPSHHEGFPRVLFEAMIKSCVIVTTMVGGIPAVMQNEVNCMSIPVGHADGIADVVERLSKDLELMQQLSESGRDFVLNILRSRPAHLKAVEGVLNDEV